MRLARIKVHRIARIQLVLLLVHRNAEPVAQHVDELYARVLVYPQIFGGRWQELGVVCVQLPLGRDEVGRFELVADVAGAGLLGEAQPVPAKIGVHNGTVMVDDARVVKADIPASNGGIHVIDRVILPEGR